MNITMITGLKPLRETYALGLFDNQIKRSEVNIDWSAKSSGGFNEKNAKETREVSDKEHNVFLMYKVYLHLLCTQSLPIPIY